ncbi:MAG: hypothetical protein O7G87_19255 [bacterium]|nr:hypothetical protein [bacterium]
MPNRIDTRLGAVRPERPEPAQQANGQAQEAPQREAQQANPREVDRVEISQEARERVEANRPQAGGAPQGEAQVATPEVEADAALAGEQGAVTGGSADRAAQLRETQQQAQQEATGGQQEQQGNLVDVVG